ncbi:hypothetical protein NPIL_408571 [Nephila pilipes]|uniref:Uncharacterized protein n=1 Tax=Nephila pilipes TaxID=299642 RepID=A0A8X6QMR4_NEPPI|nr:hypothetical protein NPIL_408571 [Nephila pilipes]
MIRLFYLSCYQDPYQIVFVVPQTLLLIEIQKYPPDKEFLAHRPDEVGNNSGKQCFDEKTSSAGNSPWHQVEEVKNLSKRHSNSYRHRSYSNHRHHPIGHHQNRQYSRSESRSPSHRCSRSRSRRQAKDRCNGRVIDGRKVRVDFSFTKRAHNPTPGIYKGKRTNRKFVSHKHGGYKIHSCYRSRSYSPHNYRHD